MYPCDARPEHPGVQPAPAPHGAGDALRALVGALVGTRAAFAGPAFGVELAHEANALRRTGDGAGRRLAGCRA